MVEGSISSHLDNDSRPESKEQAEALTPEDIAWVDSCLIKEVPDISDGNWNLMKDALLEVLDLYPQGFESSLAFSDNVLGGTTDDVDMLLFNDVKEPSFPRRDGDDLMNETGISLEDPQNNDDDGDDSSLSSLSFSRDGVDFDLLLCNNVKDPTLLLRDSYEPMNETEIAVEDQQNHDDIDSPRLFSSNKNPFLPTYKEESIQTGSSNGLSETEFEPPINDIFRVWDLNLPQVEDELVEQLNKALSQNSAKSLPSMYGNLSVLKDSKKDSLGDLINSISDLSLKQNK